MSTYQLHGENVNGDLTLGETIADLGGVKIGFEALMEQCHEKKLSPNEIFKQQQLFFLNFCKNLAQLSYKRVYC